MSFLNPLFRVIVYIPLILFGSIWCWLAPPPPSYFSNKNNFINVYFAKLSFGWTATLVGIVILFSSYVYTNCNYKQILRHLCRVAVTAVAWISTTSIFDAIRSATGQCTDPEFQSISNCSKYGGNWTGFDASGHCFVMTYFSLLICEEIRILCNWKLLLDKLQASEEHTRNVLSKNNVMLATYILDLFAIIASMLLIIWDLVLLTTVVYHHTMYEKWTGGAVGIIMWFITYKYWYRFRISPTLPGSGPYYNILSRPPK